MMFEMKQPFSYYSTDLQHKRFLVTIETDLLLWYSQLKARRLPQVTHQSFNLRLIFKNIKRSHFLAQKMFSIMFNRSLGLAMGLCAILLYGTIKHYKSSAISRVREKDAGDLTWRGFKFSCWANQNPRLDNFIILVDRNFVMGHVSQTSTEKIFR